MREEYRDLIDIQLVAFPAERHPQEPRHAGTAGRGDRARRRSRRRARSRRASTAMSKGHLDVVFGVAEQARRRRRHPSARWRHARPVRDRADRARTSALGMQGHVAVSHAYALGDLPTDVGEAHGRHAGGMRRRDHDQCAGQPRLSAGGAAARGRRHRVQRQRQYPRFLVALWRWRHAGPRHDDRLPLRLLHRRRAATPPSIIVTDGRRQGAAARRLRHRGRRQAPISSP